MIFDEVVLVGGSTHIPAIQEVMRKETWKITYVTINFDEVVVLPMWFSFPRAHNIICFIIEFEENPIIQIQAKITKFK